MLVLGRYFTAVSWISEMLNRSASYSHVWLIRLRWSHGERISGAYLRPRGGTIIAACSPMSSIIFDTATGNSFSVSLSMIKLTCGGLHYWSCLGSAHRATGAHLAFWVDLRGWIRESLRKSFPMKVNMIFRIQYDINRAEGHRS